MSLACRVPVAGIEAFERVKGKWFCLARTSNNFFSSEGMGAVSFPLKVRLTSIMNEQLEATILALKNDVVINSDVQFSDTKVRGKRYTCQYASSSFIDLIYFLLISNLFYIVFIYVSSIYLTTLRCVKDAILIHFNLSLLH